MFRLRSLGAIAVVSALLLAPVSGRAEGREHREDITILRDGQFDRAHGVRSGSGTPSDPYVISGWNVHTVRIADTGKAVKIVNNTIELLVLNWIGEDVTVRGNDVGDLRVNENVERTGAPTSGQIVRNRFGVVGQLRHFDGMFMHNVVGTPRSGLLAEYYDVQAVNFDGFNGAHFAHNAIYGYVDARLHGHHHSSGYGDDSHMHTARASGHHGGHDAEMVDHTERWHQVVIEDNEIHTTSNYYGLAYLDTGHDGNDRTATSETDEALNDPHVHHTRVHIMDNRLYGAGILVDVFNAPDEIHESYAMGSMHIARNTIRIEPGGFWPFESRNGIEVWQARAIALRIEDNVITAAAPRASSTRSWETQGSGISLNGIRRATIMIIGNRVADRTFGVYASGMTKNVRWVVRGLRTEGVSDDVSYDGSVANPPE